MGRRQPKGAERKLTAKLGDADLAAALVAAGFANPAQIRDASDKELEAVPGIGKVKRGQIRAKFPKRERRRE